VLRCILAGCCIVWFLMVLVLVGDVRAGVCVGAGVEGVW